MASSKTGRSLAKSVYMVVRCISPETLARPGSSPDEAGVQSTSSISAEAAEIARLDGKRRELGCSQAELAGMIGVSQSSLSRLFRLYCGGQRRGSSLATRDGLSRVALALEMFAASASPKPPSRHTSQRTSPHLGDNLRTWTDTAVAPSIQVRPKSPSPLVTVPGISAISGAAPPATYRVLIAEDDPETVALYATLFTEEEKRLHYEVTLATTAAECLQRLRATWKKQPYHLLLMDLGLGDRHGISSKSLLSQLQQRPLWVPPHLLVVSGVSPYHLRSKVSDLAKLCAAFLAKPFDIDELLDSAYGLVTGNKQTSRSLQYF
ncbi:MAG: response regulator [Ktedonobacterales bacterium]